MAPYLLLCVILSASLAVDFTSAAGTHQQQHRRQNYARNGTAVLAAGPAAPPAPAFKCVKSGFFGDLKDCTRFYRCVDFFGTEEHFTLFEFVCAEGTIFDESISVCNHPSWVNPPPACLAAASSSSSSSSGGVSQPVTSATPSSSSSSGTVPNQGGSSSTTSSSGSGVSEAAVSSTPCPHTTTPASPVSAAQGGSETTVSQSSSAAPVESTESVSSAGPDSSPSSTDAPVTSSPDVTQTESTAAQVSTDSTTAAAIESVTTPTSSGPTDANLVSASPIDQPPVSNVAPFTLQCGDQKFHRHPLRCDLYYQCVWTELHFSIDLKACPQGSNYDEASDSCVSPDKTTPCQISTFPPTASTGTMAPVTEPLTSSTTSELPSSTTTEQPASSTLTAILPSTTTGPQYSLAPGSLYDCKKPGHFPYQLDCIRFYRCFEVEPSVLKGLLYRCPPDYGYSTKTERCEKQTTLPTCDRTGIRLPANFPVPLISLEETTMVRLEDFESFFGNPNYFYRPRQFRFQYFKK